MSSRRVAAPAAAVPNKTSAAPVSATNRAVPLKSSIQINAMRPPTTLNDRNEVTSRLVTSKSVSKDLVTTNNKMSLKTSASSVAVTTTSKPLWHSVKSLGSRVAPGSIKLAKEQKSINNKEEQQQMVSSTGTESSGIFSDSENAESLNVASNNNKTRILRPPQTSTSRLTAAMAKTTSKLVKRPPPPSGKWNYDVW